MRIFSIVAIVMLTLVSCGAPKSLPTAEVNYISSDANGTLNLKAIGYGENEAAARFNAEKNAFDVLFFRGIPGSGQRNAMISTTEGEALSKHRSYFDEFYNNYRYRTFVMSSHQLAPASKDSGYKKVILDLKVNINSLRKDLEANNIIRKFGL